MTLQEIKQQIEDMKKRYRLPKVAHSTYSEVEAEEEVKFVDFHLRYKVDNHKK